VFVVSFDLDRPDTVRQGDRHRGCTGCRFAAAIDVAAESADLASGVDA
jgi:hypothetical protein